MPGNRHDPKKIMALQPPIINGRMAQIVKGKVFYSRPLPGRLKSPLK